LSRNSHLAKQIIEMLDVACLILVVGRVPPELIGREPSIRRVCNVVMSRRSPDWLGVVLLAGGVGVSGCQVAGASQALPQSTCPVSRTQTVPSQDSGTLQLHIGGTLAGPADMVAGSAPKGEVWAIRTSTPDLVVPLSAVQIGGPGRVTFQLLTTGTTVPLSRGPAGARAIST
jgi:hypothetical protein